MALESQGFELSISIMGVGGNTTSLNVQMLDTVYADALADAAAFVALLALASDGIILGYRLSNVIQETVLPTPSALPLGAQAEVSASLTAFVAGQGSKKANVRIPIPKGTVWNSPTGTGQNTVDLTQAIVTNYYNAFTATSGYLQLSDGEQGAIDGLVSGIRVTRGKRGG